MLLGDLVKPEFKDSALTFNGGVLFFWYCLLNSLKCFFCLFLFLFFFCSLSPGALYLPGKRSKNRSVSPFIFPAVKDNILL